MPGGLRLIASPECAVTADADTLYMVKFMLTHVGFGLIILFLLVPKLTGHHRALHSTNAVIALWTIALGESVFCRLHTLGSELHLIRLLSCTWIKKRTNRR